ncbi:hypothetical protein X975_18160, partial [Stegodyphus mimosarum]
MDKQEAQVSACRLNSSTTHVKKPTSTRANRV